MIKEEEKWESALPHKYAGYFHALIASAAMWPIMTSPQACIPKIQSSRWSDGGRGRWSTSVVEVSQNFRKPFLQTCTSSISHIYQDSQLLNLVKQCKYLDYSNLYVLVHQPWALIIQEYLRGCGSSNWGVWQQQLGGVTAVKRGVGLVGPIINVISATPVAVA